MVDFDALSLGFRNRFLRYDEITEQLGAWQKALPEVMHTQSLGKTEQGRDIWLVTLGRDPERARPAVWLDGNIHAGELAGSSVCLSVIEDVLKAFAGQPLVDLPDHVKAWLLEDVLFYVMPRMCPDGSERVIERHHFVRSNPRDHRQGNQGAYWRHEDVDGDGLSLLMRAEDPAGDFVASAEVSGLMLPRSVEDSGPFYRIYPEGFIERYDGFSIPRPSYLSDSETDMNRNFPSMWQAEPTQLGAGAYPTSEPESRAVTEFAVRHPNIFVWLCMHTYGGVYIRPLADKPDSKMDPFDAAVFRQIERWGDDITGYPTVSNFTEFTYEPEKPLFGDLANFAYQERGAIGFVCEIWDFYKQVGFPVLRPFIKNYETYTGREHILQIAKWDRDHNQGRMVGAWRAFDHPQLGAVEIGGYDPLVGVFNPPYERLPEICDQQSRFFLRTAAMAPRVTIGQVSQETLADGVTKLSAVIDNLGYLPTYVLGSARNKPFCDPLRATLELDGELGLVAGEREQVIGQLHGWGGNDRSTSLGLTRSALDAGRRRVEWVVRGQGSVEIRVSGARVGTVSKQVAVG